ncbi:MAG: hypothetical protein A2252_12625 [Elusimicrobia bacterium RIFOXYA2_FULL_39_19]|nr:MAG: hypothetical protein A2252_12625 [Elusimicrobia bacterium RIFOXYA2_FULL_39_19]
MKTGLIQVYTGNGKGKTTASIGLAIRACGQKLKVCYTSFGKNPGKWGCGEHKILKHLGIDTFCFTQEHPHFHKSLTKAELKNRHSKCLKDLIILLRKKKYDLLILDEINNAIFNGYIEEKEVLNFLNTKPKNLEVVLTGRGASKNIIKKADLVSEIKKIKHPYDKGIYARKGIEF